MKIKELFEKTGFANADINIDYDIDFVTGDSRIAVRESVFVCLVGAVTDGHLFAENAYANGCRVFVAEHELSLPDDAVVVYSDNTRISLANLSCALYGDPSAKMTVIGITGTKGKTTTALMIKEILCYCGIPTGYIGSNGVIYGDFSRLTVNTTPESCDIQKYLYDMLNEGIRYCVIEVSSQGLYYGRVRNLKFDTCVFTNLGKDHIGGNEHPSFEHYRDCKASLFRDFPLSLAVVNADDRNTPYMIKDTSAKVEYFGLSDKAENRANNVGIYRTDNVMGIRFHYSDGICDIPIKMKLPGIFNVYNALAAITVCKKYTDDTDLIKLALKDITVKGRTELVTLLSFATIVIDYAHNGMSMEALLKTIAEYDHNKIITVFGSVGGRTKGRRAELGKIASKYSDYCIITSDNPDFEDPYLICREIADSFVRDGCPYEIITDRKEAIIHAMNMLRHGDVLVLAGKGHEDYQFIRGHKQYFNEREIVTEKAEEIMGIRI